MGSDLPNSPDLVCDDVIEQAQYLFDLEAQLTGDRLRGDRTMGELQDADHRQVAWRKRPTVGGCNHGATTLHPPSSPDRETARNLRGRAGLATGRPPKAFERLVVKGCAGILPEPP